MPISFPPANRGPAWIWGANVAASLDTRLSQEGTPNLAMPGQPFDLNSLNPGLPVHWGKIRAVNLRNLGFDYEDSRLSSVVNIAFDNGIPQVGVWQTDWAASNRAITGVSRDSTGTILGLCVVDLFVTATDQMVYSVTSDASGNFSFGNPGTGPFYIVAYKTGSPDVAGTTVNTLVPLPV